MPRRVIFVHGAGGGGWEWSVWARVFAARGWLTSAPDLLPSAEGLAATTFEDYRNQVISWVRSPWAADAGLTVLVGASLGGLLALSAAAEVATSALILVNSLPPAGLDNPSSDRIHPAIIPWGSHRSIASTRKAMPDADDAACLFAWRRWRDESGRVVREARIGVEIAAPTCPLLIMASDLDKEIPASVSRNLAMHFGADFICLPESSHVGPLLGRHAAPVAARAANWLDD
ncbi:MAG: alpha/beta hydrolase family protein, partial [Dokdonella sp.]